VPARAARCAAWHARRFSRRASRATSLAAASMAAWRKYLGQDNLRNVKRKSIGAKYGKITLHIARSCFAVQRVSLACA